METPPRKVIDRSLLRHKMQNRSIQKRYIIKWKVLSTGFIDQGSPQQDYNLCKAWVETANKTYPDTYHWVEEMAELEELQEKMHQIRTWINAYPLSVFPEPDFEKAASVLKQNGMTLDAISASNMRHVLEGIKKIIETHNH